MSLVTPLAREFGMTTPIFAFSYMPDVVIAVTNAGGLGVLGCVRFGGDAAEMQEVVDYVKKAVGGKPFGLNVVTPMSSKTVAADDLDGLQHKLEGLIPEETVSEVNKFLTEKGVPALTDTQGQRTVLGWTPQTGAIQLEVALRNRPDLLVSALGPPPEESIKASHDVGIPVAALVGRVDQARKQRDAGVDIIVAQGTEAGGHTGEIASFVLTPEVVDEVAPAPVLHAGGVADGRQVAAALALGAQGVWTGSLWFSATEHAVPAPLQTMIDSATSADTIRSRSLTGKPARQLRTEWIDFWESGRVDPLMMPLQYMVTNEAMARFREHGREDLLGTPIGQIVGRLSGARPVADIIGDLMKDAATAAARLTND
ncbi:MAG: NAD(P)H-dependent flavin oxidoreductase YrpB (nitropropane dioxygenase family) [Glaciecola sp.]|jgi:NAD(P)H-dependent flavin oxidoreductase YrpB (nitropropane dioxygenase family)